MIFIKGDKTKDIYILQAQGHTKRKKTDEVTRHYGKVPASYIDDVNKEAKEIKARLGISNKVNQSYSKQAFFTAKYHKIDVFESPSFCLINPTKTEVNIISLKIF